MSPTSVASHLFFESQAAHSACPSPLCTGAQLVLLVLSNSSDARSIGTKSHSSCQGWRAALRKIAPCGRCREKWPQHSSFSHSQRRDGFQCIMFIYQLTGEMAAWNWCIKASEEMHRTVATALCSLGRSWESVGRASREPLGEWGTPSTRREWLKPPTHALHCFPPCAAGNNDWEHSYNTGNACWHFPRQRCAGLRRHRKSPGARKGHLKKRKFVTRWILCSWGAADGGTSYEKRESVSVWEMLIMAGTFKQIKQMMMFTQH